MWFLKIWIDLPRAVLDYRKSYKMAKTLKKAYETGGPEASYWALMTLRPDLADDVELFMDVAQELREMDVDEERLIEWLEIGCDLGFVRKMTEVAMQNKPKPDWKIWEDGEE